MKTKSVVLILFASLSYLISCEEKSKNDLILNSSGTLIGKWQWTKTYLTVPLSEHNPQTPINTGIVIEMILNSDSTWSLSEN